MSVCENRDSPVDGTLVSIAIGQLRSSIAPAHEHAAASATTDGSALAYIRISSGTTNGQLHSITSSARASIEMGTSIPNIFAVCKLIAISNVVGNSIGKSPALAPLKILSRYDAR